MSGDIVSLGMCVCVWGGTALPWEMGARGLASPEGTASMTEGMAGGPGS